MGLGWGGSGTLGGAGVGLRIVSLPEILCQNELSTALGGAEVVPGVGLRWGAGGNYMRGKPRLVWDFTGAYTVFIYGKHSPIVIIPPSRFFSFRLP